MGTLDFWARCRASSWALQRHWDNIEELYTQADLLRLANIQIALGDKVYTGDEVCRHISWCIWDVYRSSRNVNSAFGQIAKAVTDAGMKFGVITTNYDLVVETSVISHQACPLSPWHPGFARNERDFRPQEGEWDISLMHNHEHLRAGKQMFPIAELHGSVDWMQRHGSDDWAAITNILHFLKTLRAETDLS